MELMMEVKPIVDRLVAAGDNQAAVMMLRLLSTYVSEFEGSAEVEQVKAWTREVVEGI